MYGKNRKVNEAVNEMNDCGSVWLCCVGFCFSLRCAGCVSGGSGTVRSVFSLCNDDLVVFSHGVT